MKKRRIIVSGLITVVICLIGIIPFWFTRTNEFNVVYPLHKIKNNERAQWSLCIHETGGESLLIITDNKILYENKRKFKITIDKGVYMSTPQYVVEIYKDNKLIHNYYLLELNQIDFGTITPIK